MKEIYEVFRKGTFVAVVKPGSRASAALFKQGLYTGDVRVKIPKPSIPVTTYYGQEIDTCRKMGLVEQVK